MLTILYYKMKSEYTQQNTSYKKMVRFSLCSSCDWIEAERRGGMWKFGEEEMEDRIFQRAKQMIKNLAGSAHDSYGRDNIQFEKKAFVEAELGSIPSPSQNSEVRRDL